MAEERFITLNLRRAFLKARRVKRANFAVNFIRKKIERMFKGLEVKIDKSVNEEIWKRGAKKPLGKIRLKLEKDEKTVRVKLGK